MAAEPMTCVACGAAIAPHAERLGKRADRHEDLAYPCACGWGFSNATAAGNRVAIAPSPSLNVPTEVRPGLDDVLARALNARNRPAKRWKFCSAASEDAVTWSVFRALEQAGRLKVVAPGEGEPSLLLWGVPVSGNDAERAAAELEGLLAELGERQSGRSEPDVVLVQPDVVVIVEAKYRSGNPPQPGYRGFERYLDRPVLFAASREQVAAAGFYELTRNWRIGVGLAERLDGCEFELVNLGMPAIEKSAATFASLLAQTPARRFRHETWAGLLASAGDLQPWLVRYAAGRGLLQPAA